ncbi:MAG: DUF4864 domain-containing protein [Devosia sp.]
MARVLNGLRVVLAVVVMIAGATAVQAQDAAPWQATITGQIEAFRAADADAAFGFASAPFHQAFPTAGAFFLAIVGSGYGPIMESRSHSFGEFQVQADDTVLQEVKLIGTDQGLYAAIYQLGEEPEGWRVMGVQLVKQPGMGI